MVRKGPKEWTMAREIIENLPDWHSTEDIIDVVAEAIQAAVATVERQRDDLLMALRWALQWVCPPSKPPYGTSEAESEYTQAMEDWRKEHEQARKASARSGGSGGDDA